MADDFGKLRGRIGAVDDGHRFMLDLSSREAAALITVLSLGKGVWIASLKAPGDLHLRSALSALSRRVPIINQSIRALMHDSPDSSDTVIERIGALNSAGKKLSSLLHSTDEPIEL